MSKIIIAFIWIISLTFAAPMAIALRVRTVFVTGKESYLFCDNANLSKDQLQTYRYYLAFVQVSFSFFFRKTQNEGKICFLTIRK